MAADFARSMAADAARLPALLDAIEAWLGDNGVPMAKLAPVMIAFDEILSNIVNYGGGTLDVAITLDDGAMQATVADDGPRFDPLARPAPDTDATIDDRAIGGLGIHLVREMMDEVAYAYENGRNRLTFRKTF
ncbi:anti-sigma regulatory factor [Sphingomonas sp. Root710]|uniref:ATP-binding protein n=1 Tax=Sphingomonas sp. Root710 TaxID=1736594 RepID=UPI0006F84A85|nr:ATP-binding protein [Sphingomonas sp. Root710]KRB82269.1 anti-sigma regulatory factor [Sphingomonas sp. Root710]